MGCRWMSSWRMEFDAPGRLPARTRIRLARIAAKRGVLACHPAPVTQQGGLVLLLARASRPKRADESPGRGRNACEQLAAIGVGEDLVGELGAEKSAPADVHRQVPVGLERRDAASRRSPSYTSASGLSRTWSIGSPTSRGIVGGDVVRRHPPVEEPERVPGVPSGMRRRPGARPASSRGDGPQRGPEVPARDRPPGPPRPRQLDEPLRLWQLAQAVGEHRRAPDPEVADGKHVRAGRDGRAGTCRRSTGRRPSPR